MRAVTAGDRRLAPIATPAGVDVGLWLADLDDFGNGAAPVAEYLSPDERARAQRFRFDRDRRRFVVCRGLLRVLLANETSADPTDVVFDYGLFGKPTLRDAGRGRVAFNVAHSAGYALFAVASHGEVGVDLEQIRPIEHVERLAGTVFSVRERAALGRLLGIDRLDGFFNGWTRKEAYLKACGDGLQRPLDSFDVTLAPGEPAKLLSIDGDPTAATGWALSAVDTVEGFAAAVCIERL